MKKKFVLQYPPDFDGCLIINTETTQTSVHLRHTRFEFTVGLLRPDETEAQALRRIAYDILNKVKA